MFTDLTCRHPAVFLAGLSAGFFLSACSKEVDRPRVESASSTESRATVNTAAPRADTTAEARRVDTTTQPADTPVKKPPSKSPSPPKPSIDPGRKSPKPIAVPSTAVKPSVDSAPAAAPAADQWLKYDASTNTVTFELTAGPFNFNGYTSGGATLAVPSKANMVINFVNKDGTPHSAEVISGNGPIPNAAVDPAIPRAYTNKVLEGLPQEAKDVMQFTVPESGKYRIFCGVPGHGLSGMWIWLKVDPSAKAPSFGPTKA